MLIGDECDEYIKKSKITSKIIADIYNNIKSPEVLALQNYLEKCINYRIEKPVSISAYTL
jgi:hypothetical protein